MMLKGTCEGEESTVGAREDKLVEVGGEGQVVDLMYLPLGGSCFHNQGRLELVAV